MKFLNNKFVKVQNSTAPLSSLYRLSKVENRNNKTTYLEWFNRNETFHNSLISAAKNQYLIMLRNQCLEIKNWYINLAFGDYDAMNFITNHNEHKRIADLSIARDKTALKHLYTHNTSAIEALAIKLRAKNYLQI